MDFTLANLQTAAVGFKNNFQGGFDKHTPLWSRVASLISSTTASNEYGWLGEFPKMREWIGERVVRQVGENKYSLFNRKFESTYGFKLDHLADDNVGMYAKIYESMGEGAAEHPDEIVFEAVQKGHESNAYDGQFFFDEDHVVLDRDGKEVSISNHFTGSETHPAFYLLDTRKALKPFIYQERQKATFDALTDITNERVFMLDEALFGTKVRDAAGYGFWQMANRSTVDFTPETFAQAYTGMKMVRGDYDKKLLLSPNILLVPDVLEDAAKELMTAEKIDGQNNRHRGKCEVIVCPWLSNT